MRSLKHFLCSIKFTVAFLLAIMSRVLILFALKVAATWTDITRSIKHARKSVSWFLGEASFSRELLLWKMITLSKAFVISTQFRETTPSAIRQTWYFKSFENLQSTFNEVPGIAFFYIKERTMNGNDEGGIEGRKMGRRRFSMCISCPLYVFSTWRRIASQ